MTVKTKGFTLIELLIVVAIIAILAAIAIPNFLAAQVRAKAARAKGEMRTLATALESYMIDNNMYPDDICADPNDPQEAGGWPWYIPKSVSTPIAYITNSVLKDLFREGYFPGTAGNRYRYLNYDVEYIQATGTYSHWLPNPFAPGWPGALNTPAIVENARNYYGKYRISSAGPDRTASSGFSSILLVYDPSNGTVSDGDMWRGQGNTSP